MGDHNNEEEQEEIECESQGTELDPVAFAEFTSKDDWEDYQVDNFSAMAISEAFKIENTTSLSEDDLNRHINKLKTKTKDLLAIADSGSTMSFLNKKKQLGDYKTMTNPQYLNIFQRETQLGI